MFHFRATLALVFSAALIASPAFASRAHHSSASGHMARSPHTAAVKPRGPHGQQAIDSARVTEIQQALIREHYLNGEANGTWDSATITAMQSFQADQGWQTKLTPDSRALKKLGLGPDYSGAINAKNSTFADAPSAYSIPRAQSDGFTEAAGVSH